MSEELFGMASGTDSSFAAFWSEYPRKEAKRDAIKAWGQVRNEIDSDGVRTLLVDIAFRLRGEWYHKERKYIPLPATYLRARRWRDEIERSRNDGNPDDGFDAIWNAYPAKEGKDEARAVFVDHRKRIAESIGVDELADHIRKRSKLDRRWVPDRNGSRNVPLLANFIRSSRWEDEYAIDYYARQAEEDRRQAEIERKIRERDYHPVRYPTREEKEKERARFEAYLGTLPEADRDRERNRDDERIRSKYSDEIERVKAENLTRIYGEAPGEYRRYLEINGGDG